MTDWVGWLADSATGAEEPKDGLKTSLVGCPTCVPVARLLRDEWLSRNGPLDVLTRPFSSISSVFHARRDQELGWTVTLPEALYN